MYNIFLHYRTAAYEDGWSKVEILENTNVKLRRSAISIFIEAYSMNYLI